MASVYNCTLYLLCKDSLRTDLQKRALLGSRVAEWLALLISDHEVPVSNPTGGRFQLMTVWSFIAESFTLPLSRYESNSVEKA